MNGPVLRHDIVARARAWIGTPYAHQASLRGVGTDCLGLVRGIWREIFGSEPEAVPGYPRDWSEASGDEAMLAAARRHFREIDIADLRPGLVLIFRWQRGAVAKHAAILASPDTMIHAAERVCVAEVPFSAWWRRRLVGVFAFPGSID
jgi:NlpC/P60 family putative phage cell wall peptidase